MIGLASKFAIAQTTAIIAGFISYPFDTVRRRLQMQAEKPKEQWLYSGTLDCAVKIVKDEGIGAMFKVWRFLSYYRPRCAPGFVVLLTLHLSVRSSVVFRVLLLMCCAPLVVLSCLLATTRLSALLVRSTCFALSGPRHMCDAFGAQASVGV